VLAAGVEDDADVDLGAVFRGPVRPAAGGGERRREGEEDEEATTGLAVHDGRAGYPERTVKGNPPPETAIPPGERRKTMTELAESPRLVMRSPLSRRDG